MTLMFCLQDDDTKYGRIRGKIVEHYLPSCVGGCIFEYSDEWWKGSKDDTWHTGVCSLCHSETIVPSRLHSPLIRSNGGSLTAGSFTTRGLRNIQRGPIRRNRCPGRALCATLRTCCPRNPTHLHLPNARPN